MAQKTPGKDSVGYHELLFFGDIAQLDAEKLRIGSALKVHGSLWSRSYRNRKGAKVTETKILVEAIEWTS